MNLRNNEINALKKLKIGFQRLTPHVASIDWQQENNIYLAEKTQD